jgi:hypothetical protein
VIGTIEGLSQERERLLARESAHHADAADRRRLGQIDHDLQVLWDLRRRQLSGETIDLEDDFFDRFAIDPGRDAPGR